MKEMVELLARERQNKAACEARVADTEKKLAATSLGLRLTAQRRVLQATRAEVARLEAIVRKAALAAFRSTGNPTPHPAVRVKEHSVLAYDADEALEYAVRHLPGTFTIKLRVRDFEKAARALTLPFVITSTERRASIARDLSEWDVSRETEEVKI